MQGGRKVHTHACVQIAKERPQSFEDLEENRLEELTYGVRCAVQCCNVPGAFQRVALCCNMMFYVVL